MDGMGLTICGMTEKKAVGSSYINNTLFTFWSGIGWVTGQRQSDKTRRTGMQPFTRLVTFSILISAAPAPGGATCLYLNSYITLVLPLPELDSRIENIKSISGLTRAFVRFSDVTQLKLNSNVYKMTTRAKEYWNCKTLITHKILIKCQNSTNQG